MIKIETSDHSETISNRFLMSKLIYKIIFDRFGTFSISDSFSGRDSFFGTRVKFAADAQVHFYIYIDVLAGCTLRCTGLIILKPFPIDLSCQNWFIRWFLTNLEHFQFSDSFSSREPMSKKEKSDHSKTISNRFLMSKLVYRMIFDQFGTFSIFGLFFIKGTDE